MRKIEHIHVSEEKTSGKLMQDGIALGTVYRQPVTDGYSETLRCGHVHFIDGAGNLPHTHLGDQLLIITEGECVITSADGDDFIASKGDAVLIPAGLEHTHSAKPGTDMSHFGIMAIQPGLTQFSYVPEDKKD